MYTINERKELVQRLLDNADEQTDDNNRALDLICAFKIVQYNKFDIDVPNVRVSETLWLNETGRNSEFPKLVLEKMNEEMRKKTLSLAAHMGPNEEILNLYNVAIQRDWFASFNLMKKDVDDGLFDGMNEIEAFNRKNCNAVKCLIISLLYNRKIAEEIEFFRTVFEGKEPKEYHRQLNN